MSAEHSRTSAIARMEGHKILVVEDELEARRFLHVSLMAHGYRLVEAETGQDGLNQVLGAQPDPVLLDLGLPDLDGVEVIRRLRQWSQIPIIVISARSRNAVKVTALDAGADDYLTKPFSIGELLARIRVALRHAASRKKNHANPTFILDTLRVDLARQQVFVDDVEVYFPPIEYRLLATLIKYSGKVIPHRQLLKEVWGPDSVLEVQYLRVYVTHLRRKIERDPARPRFLLTEPGIGYRLAL